MTITERVDTHDPGSPGWLHQRRNRVGGSEIAAVMGLSPWQSKFSLWHQKTGQYGGQPDDASMEWGRRLEEAVAQKWADDHGADLSLGGTWVSDQSPHAIASPDRLSGNELLEVKTARYDDAWGPSGTDEIPIYYRTQCLWYMDVTGATTCHIAVLIAGADYRDYTIRMDDAAREDLVVMRQAAADFIASIQSGERPDIDGADATYQTVRALHPEIDGDTTELPTDMAVSYADVKRRARAAQLDEQLMASIVLDHMGSAQYAECQGRKIARRQARGDGTPYLVAARGVETFQPLRTAS